LPHFWKIGLTIQVDRPPVIDGIFINQRNTFVKSVSVHLDAPLIVKTIQSVVNFINQ